MPEQVDLPEPRPGQQQRIDRATVKPQQLAKL
jgi:hypothetical protein